jgi:adenosylcobinamide kinase/adenosylcobinamide-phosphate guanylyltransferase
VLTLVLGGVKSGKSTFARTLAERGGGAVTVVATGTAGDAEMADRIAMHRRSRPPGWGLIEDPLLTDDGATIDGGVVLLESVDSLLFNHMERAGGATADFTQELRSRVLEACDRAVHDVEDRAEHVIAVSNEIGLAPLPLSRYGRAFADVLGLLNQRLAARAATAFLMIAGRAIELPAAHE